MQNNKWHLVILAGLLLGGVFLWRGSSSIPAHSDKWQAVFLTDGQVYFGKLEDENGKFAVLKSVYYLKVSRGLQQNLENTGVLSEKSLNLIKLGGEAHGPEGEMYIAKDKILFFENLKDNSTVVQAIMNNQR